MTKMEWTVESVSTADLSTGDLSGIRQLMNAAFGDRFSEEDWNHALGGWHFLVRGSEGDIISHASVVPRKLEVSGQRISAGYVEAVATQPEFQGRGLATAVMRVVADFIGGRFQIGALSGDPSFYERLEWQRWGGMTWCRRGESLSRTADEDGGILVLPTRSTPPLDLEGDIAVDWRDGDVW
jgi:aminoglycoside 2'-N-acetyltransferase I